MADETTWHRRRRREQQQFAEMQGNAWHAFHCCVLLCDGWHSGDDSLEIICKIDLKISDLQIVLRGSQTKTFRVIKCLRKLIPESMHNLTQTDCSQYLPASQCRILSIPTSVAVPQPSADVYRIDFVGDSDEVHVKWLGGLPSKCENSQCTRSILINNVNFLDIRRSRSAAEGFESGRREIVHRFGA